MFEIIMLVEASVSLVFLYVAIGVLVTAAFVRLTDWFDTVGPDPVLATIGVVGWPWFLLGTIIYVLFGWIARYSINLGAWAIRVSGRNKGTDLSS